MRSLYRLLSFYWLGRAAARGPGSLARYMVRRSVRRSLNRSLNRAFRTSGLAGSRRRRRRR